VQQIKLSGRTAFRLRAAVLFTFATFAAALFICARVSSSATEFSPEPAQQQPRGARPAKQRRAPVEAAPRKSVAYYSKFTHDIAGHGGGPKESCTPCHTIASQQQPDIKDYPGHDSCLKCHRQQFFSGARPAICSICHTVVAPRGKARFDFPKPVVPSQFADIFPHRKHLSSSTRLAFAKLPDARKKALSVQDTCVHCHKVNESNLEKLAARWPKDSFVPTPGTFMTSPAGHDSCIECHWKAPAPNEKTAFAVYEPYAESCAECHKNLLLKAPAKIAGSDAATKTDVTQNSAAMSVKIMTVSNDVAPSLANAFPLVAEAWSARISPKFQHSIPKFDAKPKDDPHRTTGCTECHKKVSQIDSLETFRLKENGVQLAACVDCHGDKSGKTKVAAIARELKEREQNPKFDCVYCHSSNIGTRIDGFDDHYKAIKRTKPQPGAGVDKK
jgi:hypothetical protein